MKRTHVVSLRLTPTEFEDLRQSAEGGDRSVNYVIRQRLFGGSQMDTPTAASPTQRPVAEPLSVTSGRHVTTSSLSVDAVTASDPPIPYSSSALAKAQQRQRDDILRGVKTK